MAHYLISVGDNPNFVTRVEAHNIQAAIESLDLADGESATVYRITSEPSRTLAAKVRALAYLRRVWQ